MVTGLNHTRQPDFCRAWRSKLACATLLLVAVNALQAETMLPDPTKPPSEVLTLSVSSVSASSTAAVAPSLINESSLQSVIIGEHRRAAVINGATVVLGETVAGETLIEVLADRVRLRTAQGSKRELLLYPGVQLHKIQLVAPHQPQAVARSPKNAPPPNKPKKPAQQTNERE